MKIKRWVNIQSLKYGLSEKAVCLNSKQTNSYKYISKAGRWVNSKPQKLCILFGKPRHIEQNILKNFYATDHDIQIRISTVAGHSAFQNSKWR